jgi:WD40 repeat protein
VSFPKGPAQPLTHDLSDYGADLDASADGHRFVTTAGSTISEAWIVPASDPSAAKQVTSDALPMVADIAETLDGKLLTRGRDGTVWMMNTDGSQRIRFTGFRADGLTVCGRFVILEVNTELIRVGNDGSHPATLARGSVASPACPANATSVVYLTWPNKIWEVPIMGGTPRRVGDVLGDQLTDRLAVSPDGRFLAYGYTDFHQVLRGWRIAVINLDGGSLLKQFAVSGDTTHNLRWSPDGESLQFLITQNRATNLWEQPLTGGETKQLTQFSAGQIFDFNWSSDGRRLLLMRGSTTTDAVLLNAIP